MVQAIVTVSSRQTGKPRNCGTVFGKGKGGVPLNLNRSSPSLKPTQYPTQRGPAVVSPEKKAAEA
jgi:hypothetical protein